MNFTVLYLLIFLVHKVSNNTILYFLYLSLFLCFNRTKSVTLRELLEDLKKGITIETPKS